MTQKMTTGDGDTGTALSTIKARAITALMACGFREIGVDGSGLRLFKSVSGALLIGVGSCRSLAYSPTGPGGRLQLVAASRTPALIYRITSRERDPSNAFSLQSMDSMRASASSDETNAGSPAKSARLYAFSVGTRAQLVVEGNAADDPSQHLRNAQPSGRERALA